MMEKLLTAKAAGDLIGVSEYEIKSMEKRGMITGIQVTDHRRKYIASQIKYALGLNGDGAKPQSAAPETKPKIDLRPFVIEALRELKESGYKNVCLMLIQIKRIIIDKHPELTHDLYRLGKRGPEITKIFSELGFEEVKLYGPEDRKPAVKLSPALIEKITQEVK